MLRPLADILSQRRVARSHESKPQTPDYVALQLVIERIRARIKKPRDFAKLSAGEQLVYRIAATMDTEIRNGGIDQYLRHSSGDEAQQVRGDLALIGAQLTVAVLDEAAQWFDGGIIPSDSDERFDQLIAKEDRDLEDFEAKGSELSREYAMATPELYEKLMDCVDRRREEFHLPSA